MESSIVTANLTLYLQSTSTITAEILMKIVPDGDITHSNASFVMRWDNLTITLNLMPQNQVSQHLAGFMNFANTFGNQQHITQIQGVQQVVGMIIEPSFDANLRVKKLTLTLAKEYNGFFFFSHPQMGVAVYDADNSLLFYQGNLPLKFFPPDNPPQTSEALARKMQSLETLKHNNIPYLETLSTIESSFKMPSKEEILGRALALLLLANVVGTLPIDQFDELTAKYQVANAYSPNEQAILAELRADELSEQERSNLTWVFESFWVLMWALGFVKDLGSPAEMCDSNVVVPHIIERNREQLLAEVTIRDNNAVLDEADLYYRYHWACVNGMGQVQGLQCGVVYHRRYALDWLIKHSEQNSWDDVVLHT